MFANSPLYNFKTADDKANKITHIFKFIDRIQIPSIFPLKAKYT